MKGYRARYKAQHKRVSLTLTNEEYTAFSRIASRDGKPVTSIVHEHAIAALSGDVHVPEMVAAELTAIRFQIANISNNINQLTHYSHIVRQFTEEGALLAELRRLQDVIEAHARRSLRGSNDH